MKSKVNPLLSISMKIQRKSSTYPEVFSQEDAM